MGMMTLPGDGMMQRRAADKLADFPQSVAIAGAWGYIGRKMLDAALSRGMRVWAHDPGPVPCDLDAGRVSVVPDEAEFYGLDADLYHLALHPEHRLRAEDILLDTGRPVVVLNEKPVAAHDDRDRPAELIRKLTNSPVWLFYNFTELYSPLAAAVREWLGRFNRLELTRFESVRGKDREAPENPRNYKVMQPVQYQETVHCLAWWLMVSGMCPGGWEEVFSGGMRVDAVARRYTPPNPQDYACPVDGFCEARMRIGDAELRLKTDFTAGVIPHKRRVLEGVGDGRPFRIESGHLEGGQLLLINGERVDLPGESQYAAVYGTIGHWRRALSLEDFNGGPYPNLRMAVLACGMASMLWDAGAGHTVTAADLHGVYGYRPGRSG